MRCTAVWISKVSYCRYGSAYLLVSNILILLVLIGSSEQVKEIGLGAAFSDRINIGDNQLTPNKRLQKRKRPHLQNDDTASSDTEVRTRAIEVPLNHIRPPPLAFPKSAYSGFLPPIPRSPETSVLREILVSPNVSSTCSSGWLTTRNPG